MLSSSIGNTILDGLFGRSENSIVEFPGEVYLGLLIKMPDNDGFNFSEPKDKGYLRIRLDTQSRINKKNFIGVAKAEEDIAEGDPIAAYVVNQGVIMFPESSEEWDPIVGFGLFRDSDTTTGTAPFLWGAVTAEDDESSVIIGQYEVPIIRAGGFKISLV